MEGEGRFKAVGDAVDVTRRALILIVIAITFATAAVWPDFVGDRLRRLGIGKIGPEGIELTPAEQKNRVGLLLDTSNAVNSAITAAKSNPALQQQLEDVENSLTKALSPQVAVLDRLAPSGAQKSGWAYLGTRSPDNGSWLHSGHYYTTIGDVWPLQVGMTITFSRPTNLRADSAPADRKTAHIQSVIPDGTKAVIEQLDTGRSTAPNEGEPGQLVWAKVQLLPKQ